MIQKSILHTNVAIFGLNLGLDTVAENSKSVILQMQLQLHTTI